MPLSQVSSRLSDPIITVLGVLLPLDRLLAVSGLGNVTLAIIPPGRVLDVAPMVGFLTADDITVVETFTSEEKYIGSESAAYDKIADALMDEAVTGDEARRLIAGAAASLRES